MGPIRTFPELDREDYQGFDDESEEKFDLPNQSKIFKSVPVYFSMNLLMKNFYLPRYKKNEVHAFDLYG